MGNWPLAGEGTLLLAVGLHPPAPQDPPQLTLGPGKPCSPGTPFLPGRPYQDTDRAELPRRPPEGPAALPPGDYGPPVQVGEGRGLPGPGLARPPRRPPPPTAAGYTRPVLAGLLSNCGPCLVRSVDGQARARALERRSRHTGPGASGLAGVRAPPHGGGPTAGAPGTEAARMAATHCQATSHPPATSSTVLQTDWAPRPTGLAQGREAEGRRGWLGGGLTRQGVGPLGGS